MHLEGVQHTLARHNDLLGLLLHGQTANERGDFFGSLPLGELTKTLLSSPHRRVNDLQKELPGARIEDEDGTVDGLCRQITLKRLVDRHAVHVRVVDKPNDLVGKQLAVVLRRQIRLSRLGRVQLKRLADTLAEHIQRRVSLHDLGHRLLNQWFHSREPVTVRAVEVVRKINRNEDTGGRRVDAHVVCRVVEELGTRVALDVVAVVVTPTELHVQPVLLARGGVHRVLGVGEERRFGHVPLVCRKEENVGTRRVHLVRLARVDRLLLHRLNLERIELLVKYLAEIHHNRLVHLLPEMRAENLDERDLERRDLSVHENASEIKLHLETNVDICAIDGGRPPERKPTVGNLVETAPLRIRELLVLHALLKAARLLPEETLPCRKIRALKQRVLENALHTTKRLDHVGTVVVEVPQLAVVTLVSPPKRVLLHDLVLLKVRAHAPALVIRKRVTVLLEKRVDAGNAAVPRVLQVLERQAAVLCHRLLSLECVLCPHALGIDKLRLPRRNVAVKIGNELVLLVRHARPKVGHAGVGLL
eukprot:Opistho-2@25960